MASARIDFGVIHRMMAKQLEDTIVVGTPPLPVLHLGETEPASGIGAWCRHEGMEFKKIQRHRSGAGGADEPDMRDLTATFGVFVSDIKLSRYAIANAAAILDIALDDQTLRDPATGTIVHQIDIGDSNVLIVNEPDEERRIRVAVITYAGMAQRWAGTSLEDHLTDP